MRVRRKEMHYSGFNALYVRILLNVCEYVIACACEIGT